MALILFFGSSALMRAQNIAQIAQSDPLVISGVIGTQNTYRYTTGGSSFSSPLSNTIYANLNVSVYGISMPFSLYYSNNNFAFSYPQLSFNLNPSYKNWTGHFGQSSMEFSSYLLTSSFNGVGVEYNSDKIHGGAFYGTLRKAICDDPTDPFARSPQYKRTGWGFKVGYGSARNYIDLYVLRAYDRESSLDEAWRSQVFPQENIGVGVRGCLSPFNWMSLTANVATSAFTKDIRAGKIDVPEAERFDKVFETRYSTNVRMAGDANLNLMFRGFNTSLSYRIVQPDYTSLGTSYISNNYHALGVNVNTMLFRKASLYGNFSLQQDNLTKQQLYTTSGLVYSAGLALSPFRNFNLTFGYNGYTQSQKDGTAIVNDTTRVNRRMNSFSVTPSYSIETELFGHNFSLSYNYTMNKDLNKFVLTRNNVNTQAIGANYTMMVKPWATDFTFSWSEQESKGNRSRYLSHVGTFDVGRSFLADNNLHVSAGMNLSYNHILRESKSLSLGGQCSASYMLKKAHSFSFNASLYRYGDVNMTKRTSKLDEVDLSISLNYAYTFELLRIASKQSKNKKS